MMKKMIAAVASTAALSAVPSVANAIELDYVGARAGTMGLGGEVGVSLVPTLTLRGVVNGFSFDFDEEVDGIQYNGDLELGSYGAQLDFKPIPLVPLFASVGYYFNDNSISATATPTQNTEIGDVTYTPSQIGSLNSSVTFDDAAPYAGIGTRFTVIKIQVALEAGALFQGTPEVNLTSSGGTLSSDPTFQAELANEEARAQEDLDNFEIYPVINASLRWKF